MHRLLKRQLRKAFPEGLPDDEKLAAFVDLVEQAYFTQDEQLAITERSLDLSCSELNFKNKTLSKILDTLPDMSMWLDHEGMIRDIRAGNFNPPLVSKDNEHTPLSALAMFQSSPSMQQFLTDYQSCQTKHDEISLEQDNKTYFVEASLTIVGQNRWLLVLRDVSLRHKLVELQTQRLEQVKRTQKQLQGLINAAPTGILITDETQKLVMVNKYICQKLSLENTDLIGRNPIEYIEEAHRDDYLREIKRHETADDVILDTRLDLTMNLPNNEKMKVEMAFSTLLFEDKKLVITAITDIGERKRLESQLRVLASTDPLTSAYNRRCFSDLSSKALSLCIRQSQPFSVLLLDLDHFKSINDTYGHSAGDDVLVETVAAITSSTRESDILGRYGGEEFIVALPNSNNQKANEIAQRICTNIARKSIETQGHTISVTASIGVVTTVNEYQLELLINQADTYLYCAKENGRNQVVDNTRYGTVACAAQIQ